MSVVLITGSCGLVGSESALFFSEKGFEIVGIDNNSRRFFFGKDGDTGWIKSRLKKSINKYYHYNIDIRSLDLLEKVFKKYGKKISLIIHSAAQPSHDWAKTRRFIDFDINAKGTLNLLELNKNFIDTRVSEARFIRAHAYFEMVKRFGGVPLVTDVIPVQGTSDQLYRPRNSEKEIYDFIKNEMDEISALLPSIPEADGRITKWTALALKSRAMLYAASVANFGSQQLNGLLGFPISDASSYYQASLDASNQIIQSGAFSLYKKSDDPVKNFGDLFIDENNNSEVIFVENLNMCRYPILFLGNLDFT